MATTTTTRPITREDAEKMAVRIREMELACARNVAGDVDALAALIEEAKAAKIHAALGYSTFAAYRRAARRELVEELAGKGMSNRTIAAVAGVTEGTVRNDLNGGAQNCAPARTPDKRIGLLLVGPAVDKLRKATESIEQIAALDDECRAELARNIDKLAGYRDALEEVIGKLEARGESRRPNPNGGKAGTAKGAIPPRLPGITGTYRAPGTVRPYPKAHPARRCRPEPLLSSRLSTPWPAPRFIPALGAELVAGKTAALLALVLAGHRRAFCGVQPAAVGRRMQQVLGPQAAPMRKL